MEALGLLIAEEHVSVHHACCVHYLGHVLVLSHVVHVCVQSLIMVGLQCILRQVILLVHPVVVHLIGLNNIAQALHFVLSLHVAILSDQV